MRDVSPRAGLSQAFRFTVLLVPLFFITLGCGRKGSPVPCTVVVPPAATDLKAETVGDRLILTWSLPIEDRGTVEGIEGFRLYKYETKQPGDLCRNCPIPFDDFTFLKFRAGAPGFAKKMQVTYEEGYLPAHGYAYKVVTSHKSGGISGDSNIVKVMPAATEGDSLPEG